jgi:phosphatidylglycerol:prolipoprotein diacylglycerol transferase
MQQSGMTLSQLKDLAGHYHSLPVHPTQLYSTIALLLIAGLLSAVYWRRTRDGQVICVFLLVEPWTRYALELLRADNPVDTLGFTVSQFLAITLSGAGLLGLLLLRLLPPRSPRAKLWEPEEEEAGGSGKGPRRKAARS